MQKSTLVWHSNKRIGYLGRAFLWVVLLCTFVGCRLDDNQIRGSIKPGSSPPNPPSEPGVLALSDLEFSQITQKSFTVKTTLSGAVTADTVVSASYCNQTDQPGCDASGGSSISLLANGSEYIGVVSGLASPVDPGDSLKVRLFASDPQVSTPVSKDSIVTLLMEALSIRLSLVFAESLNSSSFDVLVPYMGDTDNDAQAILYFCNETDDPGCNPKSGTTVPLVKESGYYRASVLGLNAPNHPGDQLSLLVEASDEDGVFSENPTTMVTLSVSKKMYRSLAQDNTSPLATGSGNGLQISGRLATFSQPLPSRVGVGDAIQYDKDDDGTIDSIALISFRFSNNQYILLKSDGSDPDPTIVNDEDWSVFRAYTNILSIAWYADDENPGIDPAVSNFDDFGGSDIRDLVANNESRHVAIYGDSPINAQGYTLQPGWVMDDDHFERLFSPYKSSEVGISQRHNGVWDDSKARITHTSTIGISEGIVYVEGLQIENTESVSVDNVKGISAGTNYLKAIIRDNLIRYRNGPGAATCSQAGIFANSSGGEVTIFNNIIVGFECGIRFNDGTGTTFRIFNNTIIDTRYAGISVSDADSNDIYHIRNNLVQKDSGTGYNMNGAPVTTNMSNNLSSDTSANTAGVNPIPSQALTFKDESNGDYRLTVADAAAIGAGVGPGVDSEIQFLSDIQGWSRPSTGAWDVGAFAYTSFEYQDLSRAHFDGGTYLSNTQWNADTLDNAVRLSQVSVSAKELTFPDPNLDTTGLFGYWRLNEATSGTAPGGKDVVDLSGKSLHAQITNGAVLGQIGYLNQSVLFDGVDDYLTVGTSADTAIGTSDVTLAAWVKINSAQAGTYGSFICNGGITGTEVGYCFVYDVANDQLTFLISNGVGTQLIANALPKNIKDDQWHHVVVSATRSDQAYFYLDGVMVGSEDISSLNGVDVTDGADGLLLGSGLDNAHRLNGELDEAMAFKRALSPLEVRTLYQRYNNYGVNSQGEYRSRIFDAGQVVLWSQLAFVPQQPSGKSLPLISELNYPLGGVNATGLGGLWKFEGQGDLKDGESPVFDHSGSRYHMVASNVNGSGLTFEEGLLGNALNFDGVDDYLTFDTDDLDTWDTGTITGWVKKPSGSPGGFIICYASSTSSAIAGVNFGSNNGGTIAFSFKPDGTWNHTKAPGSLADGEWHHFAVVADGTNPVEIFVDGKVQLTEFSDEGSASVPSGFFADISGVGGTANHIEIGSCHRSTGPLSFYQGQMDQISLWSRALSPPEIQALYYRGKVKLKLQVRSCDDSNCEGEFFVGPDGSLGSYFSEAINGSAWAPEFLFDHLNLSGRYFQYRALLESQDGSLTPELTETVIRAQ